MLQRRGTVCEAPASRGNARGLAWLGVVRVAWGGVLVVPGETRSTWTMVVAVGHGRGQWIWQGVESLINKVK